MWTSKPCKRWCNLDHSRVEYRGYVLLWFLKEREAVVKTRVRCPLDCAFAQKARKRRERERENSWLLRRRRRRRTGPAWCKDSRGRSRNKIQQEQQQWRIWRTCRTRICSRNFWEGWNVPPRERNVSSWSVKGFWLQYCSFSARSLATLPSSAWA